MSRFWFFRVVEFIMSDYKIFKSRGSTAGFTLKRIEGDLTSKKTRMIEIKKPLYVYVKGN